MKFNLDLLTFKKGKGLKLNINRRNENLMFNLKLMGVILAILLLARVQYNRMAISEVHYISNIIPKAFNGYKIVVTGDLHNKTSKDIQLIDKSEPDMVIITGGFVDTNGNVGKSVELINKIADKYPTYYGIREEEIASYNQITSGVQGAKNITDGTDMVESFYTSNRDYVDQYVDKLLVNKAKKGDEDALRLIEESLIDLQDTQGRKLIIKSVDESQGIEDTVDDLFETFKEHEEDIKLIIYSNNQQLTNITKATLDVIVTVEDGEVIKKDIEFIKGKTIISHKKGNKKGSILSVVLMNNEYHKKSPLEELLDKLTIN